MREIKFRAWLGNRGMYIITGFQRHINGITIYPLDSFGNKIDDWYRMGKETTELMQYTGLKDKNVKEIYCGDILSFENYHNEVIIFENGAFGYGNDFITLHSSNLSIAEVIGNIYENEELLK